MCGCALTVPREVPSPSAEECFELQLGEPLRAGEHDLAEEVVSPPELPAELGHQPQRNDGILLEQSPQNARRHEREHRRQLRGDNAPLPLSEQSLRRAQAISGEEGHHVRVLARQGHFAPHHDEQRCVLRGERKDLPHPQRPHLQSGGEPHPLIRSQALKERQQVERLFGVRERHVVED